MSDRRQLQLGVAAVVVWFAAWTGLWLELGGVHGAAAEAVWFKVTLCVLAAAPLMLLDGFGLVVLAIACTIAPYEVAKEARQKAPLDHPAHAQDHGPAHQGGTP